MGQQRGAATSGFSYKTSQAQRTVRPQDCSATQDSRLCRALQISSLPFYHIISLSILTSPPPLFLPPPFPCECEQTSLAGEPSVVTTEDDRYGGKQVINLTPHLYNYVLSNVREHPILRELWEETSTMPGSQMQVSPDQAQLLVMLAQILGAQRCIEVGVYTGYSSLAIAMVLPETGRLVACERDERCLEIAKKYYTRAGVAHKVDIKHGLAVDSLKSLIQHGESSSFVFAFVDAEKRMYNEYFELLLRLVRVGGLIIIDNVLWHGKVADPQVNDPKTTSIRNFNRKLFEDERISTSMVPIGDGMTIC